MLWHLCSRNWTECSAAHISTRWRNDCWAAKVRTQNRSYWKEWTKTCLRFMVTLQWAQLLRYNSCYYECHDVFRFRTPCCPWYCHVIRDILYCITVFTVTQWRTQKFCSGWGSTNSVENRERRERGSGGGSPLFMGSGDNCNLVQEISFHIVKFS